jgi:hypothetical protein
VRRLGWYPGDWVWPSLLALVVAALAAAGAVAIAHERDSGGQHVITALGDVPVQQPVAAPR